MNPMKSKIEKAMKKTKKHERSAMVAIKVNKIKSIETRRYILALLQSNSGLYYVKYQLLLEEDQPSVTSEGVQDLNNALMIFDVKRQELEGN